MLDRLVWAEINLDAYRHNLQSIRNLIPASTQVMAVLKANAYGHGAIELAKVAIEEHCAYIGVVCLYEAQELRQAGITAPILVLNYLDEESLPTAVNLQLSITVMDRKIILALGSLAATSSQPIKVHLKVDTGMHRAGCSPEQAVEFATLIMNTPGLQLEGLFTHFATADDVDLSFAQQQLAVFQTVLDTLAQSKIKPPIVHAANSAATIALPQSHFNMVRPGIAAYGLSPFSSNHPRYSSFYQQFKPVLQLKTKIIQIKDIAPGESVGYGQTFVATRKTKVAVIPIGYGDGFRRAPNSTSHVLVNGQLAPIIGRVSMDQTTIDVTDTTSANVNDEVIIIGHQKEITRTVDQIAEEWQTINYEVTTSLASRVSRMSVAE